MANIKEQYRQHIQNTAPDMDKLWNRIESEIDKTEANTNTNITPNYEYQGQIKHTKNPHFNRIAAAAAAAAIAIVGGNAYRSMQNGKLTNNMDKTDNTSAVTHQAEEAADNEETAKPEDNAGTQVKDEAPQQAENFGNDGDMTEEFENIAAADNAEPSSVLAEPVSYESLALAATPTVAYESSFTPKGSEYFVEADVLAETDYFADVTVEEAALTADGGSYTLSVNAVYDRSGEEILTEITLQSTTPYVLQQNREYLLPLKYEDDRWYLVFENAPQIELTLDGGAVYQNGWHSLDGSSQPVEKDSLSSNDFYYDRLLYSEVFDLQALLDSWRNA